MPGHIVPMGAGLAVMQRRNDPLHDYVLELTGKDDPVVLFLPTATGDDASYIVTFYEAFHSGRCRPRHLRLFHRDFDDLTDIVLELRRHPRRRRQHGEHAGRLASPRCRRTAPPGARRRRGAHGRQRRRAVLVRRRHDRLVRSRPSNCCTKVSA